MTPSPASPAIDAKGLSKERIDERFAESDRPFAVVSSEYARPFLLGFYSTLEAAVRAQGGSPDKWHIYTLYAASPPVAVRVKPLEWQKLPAPTEDVHEAYTPFGSYRCWGDGQYWYWDFKYGQTSRACPSRDAAKAAAQADYEQRIRNALDTPASSVVEEGMGQPVRDLIGAAKRVYDKLASETASVNILDQEALGVALAALTPGVRP